MPGCESCVFYSSVLKCLDKPSRVWYKLSHLLGIVGCQLYCQEKQYPTGGGFGTAARLQLEIGYCANSSELVQGVKVY